MDKLDQWIVDLNDGMWTWLLIPLVIVLGLYFTVRSGAVQLRMFPEMLRVLKNKPVDDPPGTKQVSAFGAFTISAASRVGTGNIAGVATAISLGGPGAVFWMWMMAFVGSASAFVESTLAQLYKVRGKDGYRGGPAYYMQYGLNRRWMGLIFAVAITLTFGLVFNAVQTNTITATMKSSLPKSWDNIDIWVGVVVAILSAAVVFGGARRISKVTEKLVPIMAIAYLLLGIAVVVMHIGNVPRMIGEIVGEAFGIKQAVAGGVGEAIRQGIRRGMFSNEAGLGSAPNAGAAASVTHPVKQGLVQALGVFFDTIIICSITAFIILATSPTLDGSRQGSDMTQNALKDTLGTWSGHALTVIIFMLAFSSVIGNYYYAESNLRFINDSRNLLNGFRVLILGAVFFGAIGSVSIVWNLADVFMGGMALINLAAIAPLSVIAFKLLRDYQAQQAQGLDPVFTRDRLPGVTGIQVWESGAESETVWEASKSRARHRKP